MAGNLGLYCKLYPATPEKQRRVVELLRGITPFYRKPEAKCTTWCYLTPSKRPGALHLNPAAPNNTSAPKPLDPSSRNNLIVAGLEIYTDKSSLSTQLNDTEYFQPYHASVKAEELYTKDEALAAWYPAAGFLARGAQPVEHEAGMLVIVAELICRDGSRGAVLEEMGRFAEWVAANEPGTLSYSLMVRPKAPNEVLVFERYRSAEALGQHISSRRCKDMSARVGAWLLSMQLSEWEEVGDSFVGELPTDSPRSKF